MININIYSDWACSGNPGNWWRWVVIIYDKKIIKLSWSSKLTTNNQMEMKAIVEAMKYINDNLLPTEVSQNISDIYKSYFDINNFRTKDKLTRIDFGININIYTDSKYVYDGINSYITNWKKNWRKTTTKQPVKNQELWMQIDFWNQNFSPKRIWVKWHADNKYNNLADKLATWQIKPD